MQALERQEIPVDRVLAASREAEALNVLRIEQIVREERVAKKRMLSQVVMNDARICSHGSRSLCEKEPPPAHVRVRAEAVSPVRNAQKQNRTVVLAIATA
jgi:hypothetical protein